MNFRKIATLFPFMNSFAYLYEYFLQAGKTTPLPVLTSPTPALQNLTSALRNLTPAVKKSNCQHCSLTLALRSDQTQAQYPTPALNEHLSRTCRIRPRDQTQQIVIIRCSVGAGVRFWVNVSELTSFQNCLYGLYGPFGSSLNNQLFVYVNTHQLSL